MKKCAKKKTNKVEIIKYLLLPTLSIKIPKNGDTITQKRYGIMIACPAPVCVKQNLLI